MFIEQLERIVGQPEGQHLEYKTVLPPPSLIARVVAAFANSDGGVLICGVRDDLVLEGIADDVPASSIVDSALSRLRPRPIVNHQFAELNGKRLYIIEVSKSPQKVITEDGIIYLRVGARQITSRLATGEDTSPRGQNKKINDLLIRLDSFRTIATESKQRLLAQYSSLLALIDHSKEILFPDGTSKVPKILEGKALVRLLMASFADSFETYLADLLFEIYLAKPDTLKSPSPVTVQEVLDCVDREAFIQFIANKKISALKKENVKSLVEENGQIKALGIFSNTVISEIDKLFQIRHLFVHSNGRIDAKFVSNVAGSFHIGDDYQMTVDEICEAASFLSNLVDQLDKASIVKYSLSNAEV